MQRIHDLKQLYEIDDSQWLGETVSLLRNHQFSQLDLEHLIEELEDLGKEKKNAVASLLEQVIRHLLLLQYWTNLSMSLLTRTITRSLLVAIKIN